MPDAQIPEVTNGSFNYHCTADGCNYSKRDLYGIVLHMRTHFVYETAKSDMDRATFAFQNGRYQCFDCDRNTNSMLSFKEHVRHHILKYPYMCGHCMASVGSICELRKHSSSDHPKTPLQLRFAEMNGQLNTIMSSLGPVRQTFTFGAECEAVDHSSSHSLSTDCDIVCSESFAQMNEGPIYNMSPTKIVAPVQRREYDLPQQQSKSIAVEPNLHNRLLSRNVMKNAHGKHRKCVRKSLLTSEQKSNEKVTDRVGIGKFTFTDNKFQCLTCKFGTLSEYAFQKHVGVHFHSGDSRICRNSCADGHCPFVFGILMAISSIRHLPASKASNISSLRRRSLGNTNNEVDAHKNAPIALEIPDLTSSSPLQDLSNSISASKSTERQFPEQPSPDNGAKDSDSILKVVPSEQLSSALRFSQKNLASLRSKAGELLDLSNIANDRAVLESEEQAPKHVDNSGVGEETNQNSESSVKASTSEFFIIDSDDSADSGPNDKQGQKRKSDSSLLGYFEFVHDSTPLSTLCKRCSYTCNCKVQLKYHQDTCHNALQDRKHEFHCPECFFSGNSKQILIWHMAHHIGSHSLTFCICGFCSYQTSSVPHIKKHLRHQHPNRSSNFKTEDSKVDYMDGIFKCPVCNAGFPWGNLFFRHVASQHGSQELADYLHAIYGEKVCPELIRIPKVLLPNVPGGKVSPGAHSTENDANEVFYCFKCDIGFKTSDDLIKHCSGHTKDRGEKMGDADKATDCVVLCDETVIDPKQVKKPSSNIVQSTIKQLERNKLLQPKKRKWKERSKPLQSKKRKWNVKFGNSREDKNASGLVNKRLEHVAGSKCQTGILYKSRNNWIKKYKAPMAGKKSCVSDLPSSVPTLPRNLEMSSSSDFEKSLPNMYVFSEAIKCPKCYYSDRVRLNLVRHYNGHFKDSSKSGDPKDVAKVNSVSESELSFSLWQPKCSTSDREINNDGQTAVDRQDSCDSDVEVSYNKTQINDKTSTMSTKIIKITVSSGAKSGDKSNSTNAIPYFGQFLENHAKKTSKMIACYSCSETFSNDGDRDRHATSVHSSTYYVCRCCGIMVHGLSFVYKHYKEMHPGSQVLVDPWTPSWRGTQKSKIEEASDAKIQDDISQLSNEGRKMAGELGMNSSDQLSSATDCSISSQKKPIKDKVINAPEEQKCHSDSSQDVCITISDEVTSSDVISTSDSTAVVSTQQLGTEVSYGSSAYPINPNPVSTSPEFNINMLYSVLANVVSSRLAYNQTVPAVQMPAPSSPLVSPADVMAVAQSLLNTPQCLNLRNPPASAQIMAVQNALAIYRLQSLLAGASQPDVTQAARIVANCLMTGLSSVNAPNTWQPFSSGLAAGGPVSFSAAASAALASGGATNISSLNEMSNESVNRVGESCRVTDILKPQDFGKTIVTEGDESSQPSISSLECTSKIQSCDSSSKLLLSDSEHFYTSDPESMSGASHCSGDSKTSRFAAASAGHSKRLAKKNHKKGHKFYSRSDISENNSDAFSANYSRVVSADAKNQEDPLNLETDPATPDPVDSKNLCFCCHCCQYSTRNRQHFKNHLSKHLFREFSVDPKSWKPIRLRCGFCSFHTFLDEEFDEHVLTHTVDKPFQCHHCSYSTFTKVSVLRHLTRFHPDLEPRFEKRKDIRVERKRHQPRDTIINFHPVVKIRNLMTLSRMDIKCLQYDHNLKKIDLKF